MREAEADGEAVQAAVDDCQHLAVVGPQEGEVVKRRLRRPDQSQAPRPFARPPTKSRRRLRRMLTGSNAYWARYMRDQARGNSSPTIDVVAYDINTRAGGKILFSNQKDKKNRTRQKPNDGNDTDRSKLDLRKGGPEVLKLPELKEHTLFLCYPDEEDAPMSDDEGIGRKQPMSFGWQCLNIYQGTYVIHVGELAVLGDATLNMEQSPWGRSSSSEFQQRLASEFHCIAKLPLPNWLHVRDSISVWKRSEICQMIFVGDDDDEDNDDDEEIFEYRHIPPDEMLPTRVVAPCMAHLLSSSSASASVKTKHKTPVAKPAAPGTTKSKSTNATREEVNTAPNSASITEKEISSTKSRKTTRTEDSPKKNDQKQITKSKRKRERQKRRQLLSENKDEEKKKKETEEKKKRSDYFQLHGKLPPPT